MLRRVTWRSWAALAAALGAYAGLGFWLAGDGPVEAPLYKYGLLAAAVVPLLFTALYAVSGNRFWKTDLGSALVRLSWCMIPFAGPLAWALWFDNGRVAAPWLAWTEVSGPALSALAWLWLGWVFRRGDRDERNAGNGDGG